MNISIQLLTDFINSYVAGLQLQPCKNELIGSNFYTLQFAKMNGKKLQLKTIWELTPEELQELDLEEWNEMVLFEWDSDWMDEPTERGFNRIYFFIRSDKNLVITSDEPWNYKDELLEFCEWQDTKVSIGWYNTRSETWHWQFMEYGDNAWESFGKCKNLKIAYRGGCGYVYTLFEYKKDSD